MRLNMSSWLIKLARLHCCICDMIQELKLLCDLLLQKQDFWLGEWPIEINNVWLKQSST